MALTIKTNKYCYFCNDNLPGGPTIPLFTVTKNKEFTGKICFTSDGIVLLELLKSVGLDISFDANTSSSPRAACKKCARKILNCSTLFHELKGILIAKTASISISLSVSSLSQTAAADNSCNLLILATCCFLMYSSGLTTQTMNFCVSSLSFFKHYNIFGYYLVKALPETRR